MDKQARADEAHRILESELVQETFRSLEDHYTKQWKASTSPEEREECHRLLIVCWKFEKHFRKYLVDGHFDSEKRKSFFSPP